VEADSEGVELRSGREVAERSNRDSRASRVKAAPVILGMDVGLDTGGMG
jgi:hypothetical protein